MEEYVIGFRAIGSHMAFISEVLPGKDGDKVYIPFRSCRCHMDYHWSCHRNISQLAVCSRQAP